MATEQPDPRAELARMESEEKAAREKATKLAEANEKKKKEILKQLRAADLEEVRAKCTLHGFTATDLRAHLKGRGGPRKAGATKSAATKPAAKKRKSKTA